MNIINSNKLARETLAYDHLVPVGALGVVVSLFVNYTFIFIVNGLAVFVACSRQGSWMIVKRNEIAIKFFSQISVDFIHRWRKSLIWGDKYLL